MQIDNGGSFQYLKRPSTRAVPNDLRIPSQDRPQIPTQMQIVAVTRDTITGAQLVLESEKFFLRPATTSGTDIIFPAQELSRFAAVFWGLKVGR